MEETLRGAKTKVRYSFWTLDIWDVFLNKWGMRRWRNKVSKKSVWKTFSQMVFFSQNTRNCCFSFYKNSIKPSTYSIRIFTKDLELQLSKKCTNRIYYFSVSLSTSSSSSLSFLYFFSFLHIFTCFEALPPEFFIFCITNHNLGLFRLELSADDKLIYLRRNILDSMWLCGL